MERDFRGSWKVKEKKGKVEIPFTIGRIYTNGEILGMMIEDLGKSVTLRTKEGRHKTLSKKSLKIVA